MKLYGHKIIALVNNQEVTLTIMDKYRVYRNSSNEDTYLCKDMDGDAYTIVPKDIINDINQNKDE